MVSSDGFAAGEGQSLERPFGQRATRRAVRSWAGATASWPNRTDPGGSRGWTTTWSATSTATSVPRSWVRNKFSPHRGPWADHEWQGWWGEEPPFHTPVFVMTHHVRPSFTLSDTTFHFVNGDPATVLKLALDAADGKDVRLGGGANTVRQFLDAGLIDTLHVAVAPVESAPAPGSGALPTSYSTGTTATSYPARAAWSTTCSGATEVPTLRSRILTGDPT